MRIVTDPIRLEASICRDSLEEFVRKFWKTIVPEKLVWNWHMTVICNEMQRSAERMIAGLPREHDLLINVPPGSSKSTICSILFPAWLWTRMPSARIICSSYAKDLALTLSRKCRKIVRSEKYRRLFPEIVLEEDQDTKGLFANTTGGERQAVATGGAAMGNHAHAIVVDDPVDPRRALSEMDLPKSCKWVVDDLQTRKVDKEVAFTACIMQRVHEADPSAEMLRVGAREGSFPVRHICIPGEVDDQNRQDVQPEELLEFYTEDGLLDPVRLSRRVLKGYEATMSLYSYSGQIRQRPVPRTGGMFMVDKMEIHPAPAPINIEKFVRYWDKAATEGGGSATVGILLGRHRNGRFWILDRVRGQWDTFSREEKMLATTRRDAATYVKWPRDRKRARDYEVGIEQEPGSGGKDSAKATIRNLAGFKVRADRVTGSKEDRADPLSVQVNAGNVWVAAADWNDEFLREFQNFPRGKTKDQVDATSGAFNMLAAPARRKAGAYL